LQDLSRLAKQNRMKIRKFATCEPSRQGKPDQNMLIFDWLAPLARNGKVKFATFAPSRQAKTNENSLLYVFPSIALFD
jgi:hypothetical protein